MATVINECRTVEGKKARVSTLFKDREVLIDLIKVGLETKYGYKNLKATDIQYNKIGFVFSIDYEEEI